MRGIEVRYKAFKGRPSHSEGSDFARFFGPVLPRLRHLVWLVDDQAFKPPAEWDYEFPPDGEPRRRWIALVGDDPLGGCVDPHWILTDGFVNDYADHCNDDWNDLWGFSAATADWRVWMRGRREGTPEMRAKFLADTVEVCFFSVDGAYWEFFARDGGLIEEARAHLLGLPGIRVVNADLAASVGV